MNFPGIVDLALPADGVFHNLVIEGYVDPPSGCYGGTGPL